MTDHSDLVARLLSRPNDSPMHAEHLMDEAAATIEALRAELAARDAEIAAWLRGQSHVRAGTYIGEVYVMLARAIESGLYREALTND